MKKLICSSAFAPAFGLLFAFSFFFSGDVSAVNTGLIDANDNPDNIAGSTSAWSTGSLREAILVVINFFLFFLGLVATVFVIYGGFLYITAGGDDGKVESAKKILMYSVVGILICLMSFALINTVTNMGAGDRNET